ncbi:hypothetical protein G3M48_007138 [Beauveria asiatica]|uniref:DUF676 domain-containing protein n=1 Tax=Beauveria asiatica TaxID=1069075 RepID=A0AAW0RNC0_9HYPO
MSWAMRKLKVVFRAGQKQPQTVPEIGADTTPLNPQPNQFSQSADGSAPTPTFPDGVQVLHDCPDAGVDICFVHGLTGDRETTWTAQGQHIPWPGVLLPSELPRARILTYGYDAYVVRRSVASTNRLMDHATSLLNDLTADRAGRNASARPLIFVAHSLGGLVCKEAILLSRNNPGPHLRSIFDHVVGIIFMGTPHKGSWMANWAKIPASALGLVKSTNKSLLKILEADDQFLQSIQSRFWSMVRELREGGRPFEVTCFFEGLPFPVAGTVVPTESATLEGYPSFSIHANHQDMVKFSSAEDNNFKRLLWELKRWQEQAGIASPSLEISIADDGRFVGGDEEAANRLVVALLDLPIDKRHVRVRALTLDNPAYRISCVNNYVKLREHVKRYQRALNFLVRGGVHYYSEQEPSNLVKAVIELRGLTLPCIEDYEWWFTWPTGKPDQVLKIRFSKKIADSVQSGLTEDHPIWLKQISPYIVWERVAPAAALSAVGGDDRNHAQHIDLDDWVLSHRQPSDLQRHTPIANV